MKKCQHMGQEQSPAVCSSTFTVGSQDSELWPVFSMCCWLLRTAPRLVTCTTISSFWVRATKICSLRCQTMPVAEQLMAGQLDLRSSSPWERHGASLTKTSVCVKPDSTLEAWGAGVALSSFLPCWPKKNNTSQPCVSNAMVRETCPYKENLQINAWLSGERFSRPSRFQYSVFCGHSML